MYCGGFTSGSGTGEDFTVVRYADDGALSLANAFDGAAHGTDLCRDVLVRGSAIYAGGLVGKSMPNTSALLIKFER